MAINNAAMDTLLEEARRTVDRSARRLYA